MVLAILLIGISGVMIVGNVKGWFYKQSDNNDFLVEEQIGNASIQRKGIAYALKKGTILQANDRLETMSGASLHLKMEGAEVVIGENTQVHLKNCNSKKLSLNVLCGELYIKKEEKQTGLELLFGENHIAWKKDKTAFALNVQEGSQTVYELSGTVQVDYQENSVELKAGQSFVSLHQKDGTWNSCVEEYTVATLDDFVLNQALALHCEEELCFAKDAITSVLEQRRQEQQKANEDLLKLDRKVIKKKAKKTKQEKVEASKQEKVEPDKEPEELAENDKNLTKENTKPTDKKASEGKKAKSKGNAGAERENKVFPTSKPHNQKKKKTKIASSTEPDRKEQDNDEKTPEPAKKREEKKEEDSQKIYTCTISIHCSTILNNMDKLKQGKDSYVPSDGCILATTKVEFTEGETVYDVLKRTCDSLQIQMEASYTPIYKSYYVEGIHNLYEFDCGNQSGWVYKVNGWYPNYGCSSYKLKDGDAITWNYTCEGLGTDVS